MGGFIIRLAPRTSSRPEDKQTVAERKCLEVAVSMPMSPSSSPALNANIQNAPTVTRTEQTKHFAERGFSLVGKELFMNRSSKKLAPASIKKGRSDSRGSAVLPSLSIQFKTLPSVIHLEDKEGRVNSSFVFRINTHVNLFIDNSRKTL
ncbi:unnamed protein product [Clonostachys solani]|uniref:Uncharacterized protein n=1 Tax=Clonostachys solani TaxID=160281 RepID=A0A9N9Z2H1_9HYPO|nr:unnamed protein product [Clonostachys solani]